MNRQSLITILLTVLTNMTGTKVFAHDIEVANNDGVTIYYVWANDTKTELAVSFRGSSYSSYRYEYTGNVVIPESVEYNGKTYPVTSIGFYAFIDCSGLTSVTIPNSVTSIGFYAFMDCSGLTSVTIPNSVTYIGNLAFQGCIGLTSVTIPNSLTNIGGDAFKNTAWLNNQPDGLVYAGNFVYCYKGEMPENTKITIKDGTIGIASFAFCGSGLTSVTIPNSVIYINDDAFKDCGLTSVTIPNNVTSIGYGAFRGCSLTSVTIPNSVTYIGQSAFSNCSCLATILSEIKTPFEINSITDNYSVTLIVPVGTKAIYQSTAGWSSFTKTVEVGEGGLVDSRFKIDDINYTIGENNTVALTSANKAISGAFAIPNQVEFNGKNYSVTSISSSAFYNCSRLTSITIPNSVTSIGSSAFYNCSGLTSVIIGIGVTAIGSDAFRNTNLKKTIWLTNTPPSGYSNAAGAVNYVSNNQFSFNNKLICQYQFLSSYFDVNGIRYVPVSPSERTCDAIDCEYDESVANTIIASTVEYKGVTMSVKNIKPYLAYNNKFIKTLTVDIDGELADYAFTDCSNLETVTHGENISRIGKGTFSGCSSLTSLTMSEKTTLSNVLCIPKSVNTIDNYAFEGCRAIKNIIFMDSDAELKLGANYSGDKKINGTPLFSDCPLDSVYIGRNIDYNATKQYGYSPFYSNTSLRAVKITDLETEISDNEFYGCANLQRVVIGDGVKTIGKWAFSGCSSLKFFTFGSKLENIGQEAFSDCTDLVQITSKAKSAPTCGSQALEDINKWECKLYVPNGYLAVYQTADQWKDFFFMEEGESTPPQEPIIGDVNCDGKVNNDVSHISWGISLMA